MAVGNYIRSSPFVQNLNLRVGWTITRVAATEMILKELTGGPASRGHSATSWGLKIGGRVGLATLGAFNAALRPGILGIAVGLGVFGFVTTGSIVAGLAGVGVVAGVAAAVGAAWTATPLFLLSHWAYQRYSHAADQLIREGVANPALLTQALPEVWRRVGILPEGMVDKREFELVHRRELLANERTQIQLVAVNDVSRRHPSPKAPWIAKRWHAFMSSSRTASPLHFMDLRATVDLITRLESHMTGRPDELLVDRVVESAAQVYLYNFRTSFTLHGFEHIEHALDEGVVRLAPPAKGSRTMLPDSLVERLEAANGAPAETTPLAIFSCHDSTWEFAGHMTALAFARARILAKGSFGTGYLGAVYGPALRVLQIPLIDRGSGRRAIGQMQALVDAMVSHSVASALQIYVAGTRTNSRTGVDGPMIPATSGGLSVIMDRGRNAVVVFPYGQRGVGATAPRNSEMGIPLLAAPAAMLGVPNEGFIGPFSRASDWIDPARALAGAADLQDVKAPGVLMAAAVDEQLASLTQRQIGPRPLRSHLAETLRKAGGA